jgi:hypothetical protein
MFKNWPAGQRNGKLRPVEKQVLSKKAVSDITANLLARREGV